MTDIWIFLSSVCPNPLCLEEGCLMALKYIPEPVNVTLSGKRGTINVIMNLVMGNNSGVAGWGINAITCILIRQAVGDLT